jgi:hypothetical protein
MRVAYDGFFPNGVNFLRHLALQEKKKKPDSLCLDVEIARVALYIPFQPQTRKYLQFSTSQSPLSNDTVVSVLRHEEVGWAKSLSAPHLSSVLYL